MAAPNIRPEVAHPQFASDADRATAEMVMSRVYYFERGIGQDFRDNLNKRYKQYRGFRRWRDAWIASPRDRDTALDEAKQEWGAQLHIPLSYRTIETMVPAAISQRPRILILPKRMEWAENVANMRRLIDDQQNQISIDLPFQATMRAGRIYGLGPGKTFWRTEYAARRMMEPVVGKGEYVLGARRPQITFDDPVYEDVDPYAFGWDPMGSSMHGSNRCAWAFQRLWLSSEACMSRVSTGAWSTDSAKGLTADYLNSTEDRQRYDEIWTERMVASGLGSFTADRRFGIHEVIEYHDGERVLTVLDRSIVVQDAESPLVGCLPFTVYRPTPLQNQMVGIGDLEPLEHLQRELDTLRSQRRDAATLALAAGYVFDEAMVDREDITFGPFSAIPVRNAGDVRAAIQPITRQEPPGTSYQEEQVIRQDFDAVSGINDALAPGDGQNASTATEAQLVQAALSKRIELGSRRFELEIVKPSGQCFVWMNQRMISTQRPLRATPQEGMTYEQAAMEGKWQQDYVGPGELMGDMEFDVDGGSMAAKNVPQDRQDGLQVMQLFGNSPFVDPARVYQFALSKFGIENPSEWLKQSEPPIPPAMVDYLKRVFPAPIVDQAVMLAQRADPQLAQAGPDQQQVDQAMQPQPQEAPA